MSGTKAVERLTPGTVLDDADPAVQDFIREVYHNTPTHIPGMYDKVRTVRRIEVKRKYVHVVMECYGCVIRPRGFLVGVK